MLPQFHFNIQYPISPCDPVENLIKYTKFKLPKKKIPFDTKYDKYKASQKNSRQ